MIRDLLGSGMTVQVSGPALQQRTLKLNEDARRVGDPNHVWVFMIVHRLSDAAASGVAEGGLLFDAESVVMADGPVCWRCETVGYTSDPCPGYREAIRG